jgi:hypothetical protein
VIREFEANAQHLEARKNGNYLYHEIISLDPNTTEEISIKEQVKILHDVADKYLSLRAKNNLSYGKIHCDKSHVHLHLCISANEVYSNKRHRLSK